MDLLTSSDGLLSMRLRGAIARVYGNYDMAPSRRPDWCCHSDHGLFGAIKQCGEFIDVGKGLGLWEFA